MNWMQACTSSSSPDINLVDSWISLLRHPTRFQPIDIISSFFSTQLPLDWPFENRNGAQDGSLKES